MVNKIDYEVNKTRGFAMLVFVIVVAMSLLFMMIKYAENQKKIGDNVREIVGSEKSLQASFLCVSYISNILAKYSVVNSDLIFNIKNLEIKNLGDKNYWVRGSMSLGGQKRDEYFNCKIVDFQGCSDVVGVGGNSSGEDCVFKAMIDGNNDADNMIVDSVGFKAHSKIYVEWKSDEYRTFVSKLRLIRD